MKWRWIAIDPAIRLILELDSDDPELVDRVEFSAEANGIVLRREGEPGFEGLAETPIPGGARLGGPSPGAGAA